MKNIKWHTHLTVWDATFGLLILLLAIPAVAGVVGRDPAVVSTARSQQEAKAALEKGLPEAGGRVLLVSPHDYLRTLLLPLRRSGALKELVVLLPHDNALTGGHLEELREFLEKGGIPERDRKTLRLENGSVRGTIEGMPVLVSTLTALPKQEGEFLVVLDTAFLPAIYKNEVKTPMVGLAIKLARTLASRNVTAGKVLILDALGRPDFPLEHGFLPHLLKELIEDPGSFSRGLPERWAALAAADHAYFFAQYPEAVTQYREYMDLVGRVDPSACYKVALMTLRDLDVAMTLQWINKAAASDNLYRRAYGEAAEYLFRKELYEQAERILKGGLERFPGDPPLATALAALYIQRAETLRDTGDEQGGLAYLQMASEVEGASPLIKERLRSLARPPGGDRPRE